MNVQGATIHHIEGSTSLIYVMLWDVTYSTYGPIFFLQTTLRDLLY